MKILILGAGQVGSTVAHVFSKESQNEITVIDDQYAPLAALKERYDIRTIRGNAAHPKILEEADIHNIDIIIAVTSSDEVNIVACQLAYSLYKVPLKIARIRAQAYLEYSEDLFGYSEASSFNIDVVISPEILVTDQIKNIIELPGAQDLLRFAKGKILMISTEIHQDAFMKHKTLSTLKNQLSEINASVVSLYRNGEELLLEEETILLEDDKIYFLCERNRARQVILLLNATNKVAKRIIIAGGGNIGKQLAVTLEQFTHVKIIEMNNDTAQRLTSILKKSLVLHGDCTDENLLFEENIEQTDIYCAVTNDDQTNILSSLLAKRLGAKYAITLINRTSFLELIQEESNIDLAFSPQQVTLSVLLTYIRKGDIAQAYSIQEGNVEILEIIAHDSKKTVKIVGRLINEIKWPEGVKLAGHIRKGKIISLDNDVTINENDHIILFVSNKEKIPEIEKLFRV